MSEPTTNEKPKPTDSVVERPTPETDAAWGGLGREGGVWNLRETMKRLERERDEARELSEKRRKSLSDFININNDLRKELNEARAEVRKLEVQLDHYHTANDMAEEAFKERDEARAEVVRLKDELASVTDAVNALHEYVRGERHDPAEVADLLNATTRGTQQ